jgi:hypothetical protein
LEDSEYYIRESSIAALVKRGIEKRGKRSGKKIVKRLLERLDDSNEYVFQSAAKALGKLGDKKTLEALTERLSKEEEDLRCLEGYLKNTPRTITETRGGYWSEGYASYSYYYVEPYETEVENLEYSRFENAVGEEQRRVEILRAIIQELRSQQQRQSEIKQGTTSTSSSFSPN